MHSAGFHSNTNATANAATLRPVKRLVSNESDDGDDDADGESNHTTHQPPNQSAASPPAAPTRRASLAPASRAPQRLRLTSPLPSQSPRVRTSASFPDPMAQPLSPGSTRRDASRTDHGEPEKLEEEPEGARRRAVPSEDDGDDDDDDDGSGAGAGRRSGDKTPKMTIPSGSYKTVCPDQIIVNGKSDDAYLNCIRNNHNGLLELRPSSEFLFKTAKNRLLSIRLRKKNSNESAVSVQMEGAQSTEKTSMHIFVEIDDEVGEGERNVDIVSIESFSLEVYLHLNEETQRALAIFQPEEKIGNIREKQEVFIFYIHFVIDLGLTSSEDPFTLR
ncbi:hypothetical protein DFJ73DRAFT_761166 [Zopfochytrium polystomum]|nr:hypothetical protein DFJ73DRAFT_761166 [Zopfochytrium polystomum]